MTTSGSEPQGLGRILNSPITGFTPYIIISLFSSPNSFDVAIGCAVASALLIIAGNWMVNRIPAGQLDWAALILFGGMLIAGLVDDGAHSWLMENANLMADGAVLVMTIGGILVGRPFALMYARLSPKFEAAWQKDTPGFRDWGVRACRNISLFWFAAFIVQLGCQLLTQFGSSGYDNVVWNWIVPVAALLLAMRETHRYSAKLRAEAVKFEPAAG
ncbi:MAG: hypothetical protein KGR19_01265 [Acidobacteria bacterium]|nr:hypothetical protein [Acidobacteriota bacterium]